MVTRATPGGEVAVRDDVGRAGHPPRPRTSGALKIAVACLSLIACARGDSGLVSSPTEVEDGPIPTMIVSQAASLDLEVGQANRLTAAVLDQHGAAMPNAVIAWSSSDSTVATVDGDGAVRARRAGRARVTASHRSLRRSVPLRVRDASPVATEIVSPVGSVTLRVGQRRTLTATVLDQHGEAMLDATLAWSASDATVARVDGNGEVEAIALGSTSIVVSHDELSRTIQVNVGEAPSEATEIVASDASVSLEQGQTRELGATVLDQYGVAMPGAIVDWSSVNSAIATVDGSGAVTAMGVGSTSIVASHEGLTASVEVTVREDAPVATEIVASRTSLTMEVGQARTLGATVFDQYGTEMPDAVVAWSSSDPAIATVDGNGRVDGVAAGSASIVASHAGLTASVQTTVSEAPPVATEIVASETSVTLEVGESHDLDATVFDQHGVEMPGAFVAWSSSDPATATVDGNGIVDAVGPGNASIVASHDGLTSSVQVTVNRAPAVATEVVASRTSVSMEVGQTRALSATVLDQYGVEMPGAAIDWTTSDPSIATVDADGTVTGVGVGVTDVRAGHGSLTDAVSTTVRAERTDSLLFQMDLSESAFPQAGFDAIADTIRNVYSLERREGVGPSGQPAYRITLDSTAYRDPGQGYVGWHVTLPSGEPFVYGGTVYVRFRLRWIENTNCDSWGYPSQPSTLHRNKFHIINDAPPGGNSEGRAMIHIECDSARGNMASYQIARANRDQVCDTGPNYPADQTWLNFQYQHTWSSSEGARDGTYKIWIDNDSENSPTCEVNGLVINTNGQPSWFRWGFYYNRPPRAPYGNIGYEVTDYEISTTFDPNWNN